MKKTILLCFALILLSQTFLFGQKKEPDVILLFDFKSKQWSYDIQNTSTEGNNQSENSDTNSNKGKPFFTLRYKTQPVIKVNNLPDSNTKVKIDDKYFEVIPEVDSNQLNDSDNKNKKDNEHTFTKTMPMVDSDEVIYSVTISDSNDNPLHTTEIFAKVYGKLKIDLSTGVLFHTLQDNSYFFTDAGNEQSSISKDRSKGKLKPLFPVVMTHFYRQSKGMISPGLSLGLGLDDSGKAGYYAGLSAIIGDRQRAILTGGWAFRPTDVLKGKYEEGQKIPSANLPETTDLVESIYKSGIFFSITYNLSSKVEKREKP